MQKSELKKQLKTAIDGVMSKLLLMDLDTKIEMINFIRSEIKKYSPFPDPTDNVQWIKRNLIHANDYNPNTVAPPEMRLLIHSIRMDGYTQPIVAYRNENEYEVVDGFHRYIAGEKDKKISEGLKGYLPLVVIDKPVEERMASTIRHNRARGKHGVKPMSEIVADLFRAGWDDEKIAEELGMQADEVLRLKQRTGLPGIFKDRDYSKAWVEKKLFAPLKELQSVDPRSESEEDEIDTDELEEE